MVAVLQYASLPGVISTEQALTTTAFSGKGHVMARRIIVAPPPKDKRFIDLTGRVFGQLTVIAHHGHYFLNHRGRDFKKQVWRCRCSCGAEVIRESGVLLLGGRHGRDQSCGGEVHTANSKWAEAGERPCTKCGALKSLSDFPRKNGKPQERCRQCLSNYHKEYYAGEGGGKTREYNRRNKDRLKQKRREYDKSPRGRATIEAYQATEKFKESRRAYKRSPIGRRMNALHKAIRKARKAGLPDSFTSRDMTSASSYWNHRCAACRVAIGLVVKTHWDHWIPLSSPECPGTIPGNMLPLCEACNTSKADSDGSEWARGKFGKQSAAILRRINRFLDTRKAPQ